MNKRTKIAIDSRPLSMQHTGVALVIKQIVNGLPNIYDIDLVSDSAINTSGITNPNINKIVLPSIGRLYFEQFALLKYLSKNNPEIYVASWNYGIPKLYKGKTKFILVIHDLIPIAYKDVYLQSYKQKKIYLYSLKTSLDKASSVVCISKATQQDLKKYYPKYPSEVIPTKINKPLNSTKYINKKDNYFLYIGGVDPRKKIDNLIRAFAKFCMVNESYTLYLVGNGMNNFSPLIKELNVLSKVKILDYVSESKKNELMSRSTALVFPSIKEGFGLPVAEAIISGTAVVSGDDPALREVAGKAAIYADSNSIEALNISLKKVVLPNVQQILRTERTKRIKLLTSNSMSKKYNNLIESLLN
jgi:glycosyltransferase involved in cell wall biosynthesis